MGLILAIPCVSLYRYFGNRIDALASEASTEIERLVLHLETSVSPPTSARPASNAPRPVHPSPTPGSSAAAKPNGGSQK